MHTAQAQLTQLLPRPPLPPPVRTWAVWVWVVDEGCDLLHTQVCCVLGPGDGDGHGVSLLVNLGGGWLVGGGERGGKGREGGWSAMPRRHNTRQAGQCAGEVSRGPESRQGRLGVSCRASWLCLSTSQRAVNLEAQDRSCEGTPSSSSPCLSPPQSAWPDTRTHTYAHTQCTHTCTP